MKFFYLEINRHCTKRSLISIFNISLLDTYLQVIETKKVIEISYFKYLIIKWYERMRIMLVKNWVACYY